MSIHTRNKFIALGSLGSLLAVSAASAQLRVDFSTTGATPASGYEGYFADHEVSETFTTQTFTAFGETINLTPIWGDDDPAVVPPIDGTAGNALTGEPTSKQLITRGEATPNPALYSDWIGVDARDIRRPGNPLKFIISGIPAGDYTFLSHHHDPQNQTGLIDISLNDGESVEFDQSAGGGGGATPAIYRVDFTSDGTSDLVITFSNRAASEDRDEAANDFVVINAIDIFEATEGDRDFDGMPDLYESLNGLDPDVDDADEDLDMDGLTNIEEFRGADETPDTGDETNPNDDDSDGDGLTDGDELNVKMSNPLSADSDNDGFSDSWEDLAGSDLTDAASVPDGDLDGYSSNRDPDDIDDAVFPMPEANQLFVDFNSNQGDGGDSTGSDNPAESDAFNNQPGYSSYHANHESIEELVTATYEAFGTMVTVTPKWPDSEDFNTTQQSIGRGNGNNDRWHGDQVRLLQDWIGVDTRTGQSGNGPFDSNGGDKTRLQLFLGDLPASSYTWRSYHHDTENVHSGFLIEVSTDGGMTFTTIEGPNDDMTFPGTSSSPGGNPAAPELFTGAENGFIDPAELPSTANFSFIANGSDDVVIQFTPYTIAAVHRALFAMNGFELSGPFSPGGLRITSAAFDAEGNYVIDFVGIPNTEYEVTKSLTLNGDFASIFFQNDTDDSGNGTFAIPAEVIGDEKAFFRVEEFIE